MISEKEILEGNKIIAEFIAVKVIHGPNWDRYEMIDGSGRTSQSLKYDTDWNELMPVIGKISNKCEEPEELDELKYALLCNDIETAWEFVVDYLD